MMTSWLKRMALAAVAGMAFLAVGPVCTASAAEYLPGDKVEAILGTEGESGVAVVKAGTSVVLKGRIKKAQTKYLLWRLQQKFGNIIDLTSMEPEAFKNLQEIESHFSRELALNFDTEAQANLSKNLEFRVVEGRLVVSGKVGNPEDVERITRIAKLYDKDPVINVEIRRDMIEIDAVFCRINRTKNKNIGTTGLQQATITIPNYNLNYAGSSGKFGEVAGMTNGAYSNTGWSAGIASGVTNQLTSYFQITEQDVKLLVRPHLSTLNGKEAIFHSGGQQPFTIATDTVQSIQWKDYGTKLTVLPVLTTDNKIDVNVTLEFLIPQNDAKDRFTKFSHSGRAILDTNQALVLSGLVQQLYQLDTTRTPGLSKVPLLGFFFGDNAKDREQSEMVVVVMPRMTRPLSKCEMGEVFRSSDESGKVIRDLKKEMQDIPQDMRFDKKKAPAYESKISERSTSELSGSSKVGDTVVVDGVQGVVTSVDQPAQSETVVVSGSAKPAESKATK